MATYYVKPASSGGSDAANGTSYATAWATLQKAANTVVAGDTVKVDSGTYSNGFRAITSGTVNNRITFEPYQGTGDWSDSGILINGFSTASGQLSPIWIIGKTYITVKGFTCTTGTTKGNFQAATGATGTWFINCRSTGGGNFWGIKVTESHDCVAEGCLLEGSSGEHGIYFSGCNNYIIRGNTTQDNNQDGIHTNISDFAGQTVFDNDNGLIEDNVSTGNGTAGMDVTGMTNATVRNNVFYNNGTHAASIQNVSGFVNMPGCSGNLIVNNTFLADGGAGRAAIRFAATQAGTFSNDANTTCFNNILIGTAGSGSLEHFNGVSPTFKSDHNIVVDVFRITSSTNITFASWKTNTSQDAHSLISNAASLFTNSASDDYTLLSTSPARDFGVSSFNSKSAAPSDFDGKARPVGSTYDAGAYEYGLPGFIYNVFKRRLLTGEINLASGSVKALLTTSTYNPGETERDTHLVVGDVQGVSGAEVASGGGYSTGGMALANKVVSQDNTDNEGVFDADDAGWASASFSAHGVVLYYDGGTPSTRYLISYSDFGANRAASGGTFSLRWSAEGIVNLN